MIYLQAIQQKVKEARGIVRGAIEQVGIDNQVFAMKAYVNVWSSNIRNWIAGAITASSTAQSALSLWRSIKGNVQANTAVSALIRRMRSLKGSSASSAVVSAAMTVLSLYRHLAGQVAASSSVSSFINRLRGVQGETHGESDASGKISAMLKHNGAIEAQSHLDSSMIRNRTVGSTISASSVLGISVMRERSISAMVDAASMLTGDNSRMRTNTAEVMAASNLSGLMDIEVAFLSYSYIDDFTTGTLSNTVLNEANDLELAMGPPEPVTTMYEIAHNDTNGDFGRTSYASLFKADKTIILKGVEQYFDGMNGVYILDCGTTHPGTSIYTLHECIFYQSKSGSGAGWHGIPSGMNVTLEAGHYYVLGVLRWSGSTQYRKIASTSPIAECGSFEGSLYALDETSLSVGSSYAFDYTSTFDSIHAMRLYIEEEQVISLEEKVTYPTAAYNAQIDYDPTNTHYFTINATSKKEFDANFNLINTITYDRASFAYYNSAGDFMSMNATPPNLQDLTAVGGVHYAAGMFTGDEPCIIRIGNSSTDWKPCAFLASDNVGTILGLAHDGSNFWVGDTTSYEIYKANYVGSEDNLTVAQTIAVGVRPDSLYYKDGLMYVHSPFETKIHIIDLATGVLVKEVDTSSAVRGLTHNGVDFVTANYSVGAGYYISTAEIVEPTGSLSPTGNRVSAPINVSNIDDVQQSIIAWNETLPAGTDIIIEASIDDGATWTPTTNGGELFPAGTSLTGKSLLLRETLSQTSGETPILHDVTIDMQYKEV